MHAVCKYLILGIFVGEHPTEFDYGADENALSSGRRAALIRYTQTALTRYRDAARVFGTLAQTIAATPYHGQRIEIRADLATERVSHGAIIWARVDMSPGHRLAFDNLKHDPDGWLFGDNGWTKRRIVLDVPPEGVSLHFGLFLKGTGTVWAADFAINVVDSTLPITGKAESAAHAPGWTTPQNLDFSKVVDLAH